VRKGSAPLWHVLFLGTLWHVHWWTTGQAGYVFQVILDSLLCFFNCQWYIHLMLTLAFWIISLAVGVRKTIVYVPLSSFIFCIVHHYLLYRAHNKQDQMIPWKHAKRWKSSCGHHLGWPTGNNKQNDLDFFHERDSLRFSLKYINLGIFLLRRSACILIPMHLKSIYLSRFIFFCYVPKIHYILLLYYGIWIAQEAMKVLSSTLC
jgi:hypothetical protein